MAYNTVTTENNKRIAKNTMYLYIRMLFVMTVSLYASRVVLQGLGASDFGIYSVISGIVLLLGFFRSSLSNSTQRFLSVYLAKSDIVTSNKVFNTSVYIFFIFSVILFVLAESVGVWYVNKVLVIPDGRLLAANVIYQTTIFSLLVALLTSPQTAAIIAHEDMKFFSYVSVLDVLAKLFIALAIARVKTVDSLILYGILLFVASLIEPIISFIFVRRKYDECRYLFNYDKSLLKEQLSFVGWNACSGGTIVINQQGINLIINYFSGVVVNAARGIAMQINGALIQFTFNFMMALRPAIVKAYAIKDYDYFSKLIIRSSKYSFLLMLVLCVPFFCFTDDILYLWLGTFPEHTSNFTRLILLLSLLDVLESPIWSGALATGDIKDYTLIGSIIYLLALPASYICLYLGLPPETTFVSLIVFRFLFLLNALRILNKIAPSFTIKDYLKNAILPSLATIAVLIVLLYVYVFIVPSSSSIFIILINITATLILSVIVSFFIGLTREERYYVYHFVSRRLKSFKR